MDPLESKIINILDKFNKPTKNILKDFFISSSYEIILDEKPINTKKINLLLLIKKFNNNKYNSIRNEAMHHKAIQTRALILDMVELKDLKCIYKPDRWIINIVQDTSYLPNDLLEIYNKCLINEFKDIFINNFEKYNESGNQLLVNFKYYIKKINEKINFNFDEFYKTIKIQINENKLMKDDEIEKIVNEFINKQKFEIHKK
ncbi:hypothetical protein NAPIS_ORF00810 [Vairimorpha apis BRL 01]|uniref:Uncharacterized protein n=1 Tax=Vairimorpha apis BRL 01 TaxID=1037528 RepID=T0MEU2_9MICR|nr:hypothetical protein NAPIS_ORF00810 [Vairimorpha apis BRL 01]